MMAIICPPVEIGLTNLPEYGGGREIAPPPPGSSGPVRGDLVG